jgi:hypothetical protein
MGLRMTEVRPGSSPLRDSPVARVWAPLVSLSLLAVLPFVYANVWASTLAVGPVEPGSVQPGHGIWLAFAVLQVCNKIPLAYRYTAGAVAASFDVLGFCAGLAAVIAVGMALTVPTGPVRIGWLLFVASWLVVSTCHRLDPRAPYNQGVARWRRVYAAVLGVLVDLPFALAAHLAPAA